MSGLVDETAKTWIGRSQPPVHVEVSRREIQKYAVATEQTDQKYLSGDEAPPMFLFGLMRPVAPLNVLQADGIVKDNFLPDLPLKRVMAGGVKMTFHRPIRPGDNLKAVRTLTDIQEKEGSSGPLIFLTYTLNVTTVSGEPVVDEVTTRIRR